MGKRFAAALGAAALGAALMAVGASADFRSVGDPRGDRKCDHGIDTGPARPCSHSNKRNADIVRATAGHEGGRLRHTIRVVGKFQSAGLYISTDSDRYCELYVGARRGHGRSEIRPCHSNAPPTGRARMDFHHHSVEIFFSERSIGNPQSYGWRLGAIAGRPAGHAHDYVPNVDTRYIRHRLVQTAAKAPGVVTYDTKVTIARDRTRLSHGLVRSEVRKCERGRRVVLFKRAARGGPQGRR
jgi:hypothetical protein